MAVDAIEDESHGRDAERPSEIPLRGWKDVLWRVYSEMLVDRVSLIAAGATYYIVLALFPGMGVLVSIYGLLSDPSDIAKQMEFLRDVLPPGGYDLLLPQLHALARKGQSQLSFAFLTSLLLALWSATSGVKALFEAMNVAYGEAEKRSFFRLNLEALGFTLGAVGILITLITVVGLVPALLEHLYLGSASEMAAKFLRWPVVLLLTAGATAILYRYGPSREPAKIRWLSWGVGFSTIAWALTTILFSIYLLNFSSYDATYGALGALIGFMVWIWLSISILIVGAELNAELEHQTARDSTTGTARPMGERGAVMADTLGEIA
jgi:membrane protein